MRLSSSTHESRSRRPRWILWSLLGCVGLLVFWQAGRWFGSQSGDFEINAPIRVLSGSMAPALHGPAWSLTCEDCELPFLFDRDVSESAEESQFPDFDVCCPNCGALQSVDRCRAAQRVEKEVILQPMAADEMIERDMIVAAEQQGSSGRFLVKRVVGLPGEQIAIHNGDIYIDGQLRRKDFSQVKDVRMRVHRKWKRFGSAIRVSVSRWRPAEAMSRWREDPSGFGWSYPADFQSAGAASEDFDWIEYHHSPALPPPFQAGTAGPIKDNYGYNQRLSRTLHDARDVWLAFTWGRNASLEMQLKLRHGDREFRCTLDPAEKQATLEYDDQLWKYPMKNSTRGYFEWGIIDGQIGLAVNEKMVFMHPFETEDLRAPGSKVDAADSGPEKFAGHERPFAIGLRRADLPSDSPDVAVLQTGICELRIFRDIYYTLPSNQRLPNGIWQSRRLAGDEYLLLGDNSPVSDDARQSEAAGYVRRAAIVGQVVEE